jgi:hypothetical protein
MRMSHHLNAQGYKDDDHIDAMVLLQWSYFTIS